MTTEDTKTTEESTQRLVRSPNPLQEAWEAYHGEPLEGFDIPAAPPAYMRGFVDGVDHERSKWENNKQKNNLAAGDARLRWFVS
jgi:hypothetical protein